MQDGKRALATAALSGDRIKDPTLGPEDLMAFLRPAGGYDNREESDDYLCAYLC